MQPKESKEFVKKLYDILEDNKNEECIKWNETGSSFFIINPTEFSENILQNSFRHNNLSSFVRQLNKYDFHKIKSSPAIISKYGSQVLEFEHMYFQRDKRNQLYKIKRKSSSLETPPSVISDLLPSVESHTIFQNHVVSAMKDLTDRLTILVENINDIKVKVNDLSENVDRSVSVLIFDEDSAMAMHVYTLLKDKRVNVVIVDSQVNLYNILKNSTFDFIILSSNINYFKEVMRFFRGYDFMTPVIYMGYENLDFDIYSNGVTDFIKKPFTYSEFFFVINKYMPRKNSNFKWE